MNWIQRLLNRGKQRPETFEEGLGEEHAVLHFDETISQIKSLSKRAQTTFLYRLIRELSPNVLRSAEYYIKKRRDNDLDNVVGPEERPSTAKTPTPVTGKSQLV